MRNPKEALEANASFEKGPKSAAEQKAEKTAGLKICHPSVCVGNQKPTSCVCPTEK